VTDLDRDAARRRKALGAYYTPGTLVARALDALPAVADIGAGRRVVDLACGDGEWLAAAAERWPGARLEGVDIDGVAVAAARRRLGRRASVRRADGLRVPIAAADLVVGNPPWGAGRAARVRRGDESASAFVARALDVLVPGGRLCLLVPAAWLEVRAHAAARADLLARAAVEQIDLLGDVFAGVLAPAALVVARREDDAGVRAAQVVAAPGGRVAQSVLAAEGALSSRLSAVDRALLAQLESRADRLAGRVRFFLGVVTGANRAALDADEGEPILTGRDVAPLALRAPSVRLCIPLERTQQAAPRALYAQPKVVYRFIAPHPVAAVDRAGQLTLNSANAFIAVDRDFDLDYACGVLNSTPIRFAHAARRTLPRVLRSHLESLPLPRAGAAEQRALARLAERGDVDAVDERVMDLYGLDERARARLRSAWPRS
jgi:predicted RNA methylase